MCVNSGKKNMRYTLLIFSLLVLGCQSTPKKKVNNAPLNKSKSAKVSDLQLKEKEGEKEKKIVPLTAESAIPFFFEYNKKNPEKYIQIQTQFGNIDIELDPKKPYHRANFIYLIKNRYFDGTLFHRVVPGFIIQGGNSDNRKVMRRRTDLGRYLIPVDADPSDRHDRGVISMPSSEIDNPYKLASPYEFFIVQQTPGAYHLDGNYTPFGRVIRGMDVVDKINAVKTDNREMPLINVSMKIRILNK